MEDEKKEKDSKNKKPLDTRILEETEKSIETILNNGITQDNTKTLYELVDIHKDMINERKEIQEMNYRNYGGRGPSRGAYGENYGRENYGEYGNYGNYNGYGNYGENYNDYGRGEYGARGRDSKYRGYDHLDRMYNEYGNYSYGRERYGANEDTKKSLEYMLRSMEDFARMLKEEAQSQEEVQMINQTAQRIAQM